MTSKATDVTNTTATATGASNTSAAAKPTKYPQLFYSPDYQQLFNKEIQEITMELLQTAEVALSSFDYKTIQSIQDATQTVQYDNFGKVLSISNKDEIQLVTPQTDPSIANDIYDVAELVIIPVKNSLQIKPETAYSTILSNYGYHGSGPNIIKYKPGYRADGIPYYDLEIPVTDPDGVIGYNIYMIEEVE